MAIRDHITRVPKMRVTVNMVDPKNSVIDVIGHDGAVRRLNITIIPPFFRWPIEGEEWIIEEQNGQWSLGERVRGIVSEDQLIDPSELEPGDVAVDVALTGRIVATQYTVTAPAGLPDTEIVHTIPRKFSTYIGDGTATTFTVTHMLGTRAVVISVSEAIEGGQLVNLDVVTTTATNYITLEFGTAPGVNEFLVTVIG